MTDEQCLQQAAAGATEAFGVLVDRHADRLFRLAVSLVGNRADAEDVLQEALAGAFGGAGKYAGGGSVRAWLNKIVVTQAARHWRDRSGKTPARMVEEPSVDVGFGISVDSKIDLRAALAKLSHEHREVLVLREMQGMDYQQIASVLEVPRGTVESRLHRARGELRKLLRAYQV